MKPGSVFWLDFYVTTRQKCKQQPWEVFPESTETDIGSGGSTP